MRLIEAFTSGWNRSFDYEGRSNRGDYWWFVLFCQPSIAA